MRLYIAILLLGLVCKVGFTQTTEAIKATADSLATTGKEHFHKGDFAKSKENYFKCFALQKKVLNEKSDKYEKTLFLIAELFHEVGNVTVAEKVLQNDLELISRHWGKHSSQYARSIELQGRICMEKDEYETAENFLKTAQNIYEKENPKSLTIATNLVYQGQLYSNQGYYTAAEALFRKARFIFHKQTDVPTEHRAMLLLGMGELYTKLHNYKKAVDIFNELIYLSQKAYGKEHPYIAKSDFYLGSIFLETGYGKNAKPHVFAAHESFSNYYGQRHSKTLLAKSLLAKYYTFTQQNDKADSLYKLILEQLEFNSEEKHIVNSKIEAGLASHYYRLGTYDEAIDLHKRSLDVIKEFLENSHPFYIQTINDLSFLYWASGKNHLAENYFERSTTNYINQFNRYFAFLSEQEKSHFYHDIRLFFDKYNSYIISHLKDNPDLTKNMYNNQLATKALLFHTSQGIRKQVMQTNDPKLQEKHKNWIRMKDHLSKLYKLVEEDGSEENEQLLDSLEEKANSIEKEISLRIELNKTKGENVLQEYKWDDIQKSLAADEASVEIIRVQEFEPNYGGKFNQEIYYVALIITKNTKKRPAIIVLKNGKDLEGKLLRYYRNSIQYNMDDKLSYLHFWEPIKASKHLQNINKIYISCDGVFNQININTLIHPETYKTVFEEQDIHLVSNTKDIVRLKTITEKTNGKTILMGYPDYYHSQKKGFTVPKNKEYITNHVQHRTRGHHDLQDIVRGGKIMELPGTKIEIEEVSKIFSSQNEPHDIYMGTEANEAKLKTIENPAVLHIATHGYFLSDMEEVEDSLLSDTMVFESFKENPLTRSGIMLMGAGHAYSDETLEQELNAVKKAENYEDGILTAYEALNINLSGTDLVILSACETGLGEVKNGEGVYGLQRALQTAGAKSVIMSLWKVSDQATKELMVNFYNEWVKNHDKRKAFRSAQAKLKIDFPEAIYWGAFVMIGE